MEVLPNQVQKKCGNKYKKNSLHICKYNNLGATTGIGHNSRLAHSPRSRPRLTVLATARTSLRLSIPCSCLHELVAQNSKTHFGATTGNRTRIESSTSSSVNRYTIVAMHEIFYTTNCDYLPTSLTRRLVTGRFVAYTCKMIRKTRKSKKKRGEPIHICHCFI